MNRLVFLFLVILLASCEQDLLESDSLGENAGIVGTWVENTYQGDTAMFKRTTDLDEVKYGFAINEDGTFEERKNSGWCGTPPISYSNYDGTWEAVSDSLLDITVAYWGGMMTYQIRIVSVDAADLAIKYLYTDERLDAR
jgi:hypothetical protein